MQSKQHKRCQLHHAVCVCTAWIEIPRMWDAYSKRHSSTQLIHLERNNGTGRLIKFDNLVVLFNSLLHTWPTYFGICNIDEFISYRSNNWIKCVTEFFFISGPNWCWEFCEFISTWYHGGRVCLGKRIQILWDNGNYTGFWGQFDSGNS